LENDVRRTQEWLRLLDRVLVKLLVKRENWAFVLRKIAAEKKNMEDRYRGVKM
jgi:hypothetical protein